jgi:hypothetical protein
MVTERKKPARQRQYLAAIPANRAYVFAANCVNDFGRFAKGDKARGAFPDELVKSYVKCGILVEVRNG